MQQIDLNDREKEVISFLNDNYEIISSDYKPILDEYGGVKGFEIIGTETKIVFERLTFVAQMAKIDFYYKNVLICDFEVMSFENHWNGRVSHLVGNDPYGRKDSKHDLRKAFEYFFKIIEGHYVTISKKIEEQELNKDKLLKEFYEKI